MSVVEWSVTGSPDKHWQARAFGQTLADLAVDLGAPAPVVATRILAGCLSEAGAAPDDAELWSWTVNRRLQGLLAVTIATRGDAWTTTIRCSNDSCAEPMDLPLRLGAFMRREDPAHVTCTFGDEERVEVALPTGTDQMAWLREGSNEAGAMLRRLLPTDADAMPPERLGAVEDSLAEADPLTVLDIETRCPACDAESHLALDLEHVCLTLLAAEQPGLLDDIHSLALAYHWSEAEILAVAPERRREYLARLERGWS